MKTTSFRIDAMIDWASRPRPSTDQRILMRRFFPRSVLGLVLGSYLLITLPLIVAVLYAQTQWQSFSEGAETTAIQSIKLGRVSQQLVESSNTLRAQALKYNATADDTYRDVFIASHEALLTQLARLGEVDEELLLHPAIARIRNDSEALTERFLELPAGGAGMAALLESFVVLDNAVRALRTESNAVIDNRITTLQQAQVTARNLLLGPIIALGVLTLLLILLFSSLIAGPIRRLGEAVRELGDGNLEKTLRIGGPEELANLESKLDWLRERLAEVEKSRGRFLRSMSHELKTPLASIRESSELLLDGSVGELSKTQREVTEIMRDAGLDLNRLISNLLSYAAWHDAPQLALGKVQVDALLERIRKRYRYTEFGRGLQWQIDCEAINLHADPQRLETALDNLISNAVKFSPAGAKLKVTGRRVGKKLHLDVEDSGPGIAAIDRERIFQPYVQGSAPQLGIIRGTGIGLAIVRDVIEAHQGSIEVRDVQPNGTCMHVELPLAGPDA